MDTKTLHVEIFTQNGRYFETSDTLPLPTRAACHARLDNLRADLECRGRVELVRVRSPHFDVYVELYLYESFTS